MTVRTRTDLISRARSSRRWSESAIRPSAPTGCCGRPLNRPAKPWMDNECPGSGGGVAAALALDALRLVVADLLACLELALLGRLQVVVVVIAVGQALGLGLEDAQRPTAAAGQLGQLGGAEEQHDHDQDEHELLRAETGDEWGDHGVLAWWLTGAVILRRRGPVDGQYVVDCGRERLGIPDRGEDLRVRRQAQQQPLQPPLVGDQQVHLDAAVRLRPDRL